MCLICVEFNAGRLKTGDAWRNLQEMFSSLEDSHKEEVVSLLYDASQAEYMASRVVTRLEEEESKSVNGLDISKP